MKVVFKKR